MSGRQDVTVQPSAAPRLNGLDGLRAIAVTAVFLYHADLPWVRGGFLGVDLFFVISGFLITHLLARQVEGASGPVLAGFYWRRAKRLLPASWLVTAVAILAAWLVAPDALARLKNDTLASLLYVTNWELLLSKVSYFESIGRQPLLLHLWSLAIEEQFYIIWAPVLVLGLPRLGRGRLAAAAAVLAAVLVGWTAYLAYVPEYLVGVSATRLDFGTDTHSFPLLIGAALGLVWQPDQQAEGGDARHSDRIFTLGLAALGATIWSFSRLGEEAAGFYPWGFLASALTSAALIAAATYRGASFGRWLDQQPLRWLGERSYGLYLWHWPIFMLTRQDDTGLGLGLTLLVRILLTLAVAELSYRFVETPIRHGLLERIGQGMFTPGRRLWAVGYGGAVALGTLAVLVPMLVLLRATPSEAASLAQVRVQLLSAIDSGWLDSVHARPVVAAKPVAPPSVKAPPRPYIGSDVTVVGDSVLLGSEAVLKKQLPGVHLEARVGWQARDVLIELQRLSQNGELTPVVVLHLGTNGYVYEPQLRSMLSLLSDRPRVILINAHAPRRWVDPNNALIDRVLADYPNARLADWRRASDEHEDYFVGDGFHLRPVGQRALVGEMVKAGDLTPAVLTASRGASAQ